MLRPGLILTIFLALGVAVSGPSIARDIPFGANVTVVLALTGCRDLKTMNRLAELLIMGDTTAAVVLARRAGALCRFFEVGATAMAEAWSDPHSLVCIRPAGDPDCYWFPSNYLK